MSDDGASDPGLQRVSDAERHQVVESLQKAAGDGRLEVDELEQRLEAAWSARTYRDLTAILVDLPDAAPTPPGSHPGPSVPPIRRSAGVPGVAGAAWPVHETSMAVLSEQKRTGPWRIGATYTATAVMGSVILDLREAVFSAAETVITASAVLGSVEVHVDAETVVVIDGSPMLGTFEPIKDKVPAELHRDSPVVRVTGMALMGSVTVVRKRRPGEKRQLWGRRS